ncbi:MAG: 3-hydroxybutyryl-CoA dehydrogenase [Rhodobacteraceae bacterium]|nr:3-hydroxybutyryl-CoA dehydrogenase [Paracoccaceae bacterium]
MEIKKVGVIGAGQMGSGIVHVLALAGYDVKLYDLSFEAGFIAVNRITKDMNKLVERDKITEQEKQQALDRINTNCRHLKALSDSDLIIECAVENENVKREILLELQSSLSEQTMLTTNTSSISITRLAAQTDRPERFMGLHFMNPVPQMKLVELVKGIATGEEISDTLKNVVEKLGKSYTMSEDFPGFIVNRILMPMINEAIYALYEGVGNVESIDKSMRLGANHPMGPLQLADFIGLDTCQAIMNVLHDGLGDTKYLPCPLLKKYVDANWLGRKNNRGFYDYHVDPPKPTR